MVDVAVMTDNGISNEAAPTPHRRLLCTTHIVQEPFW